ncbi:RHS repeat domain-containing protein [Lysobacter capsici]
MFTRTLRMSPQPDWFQRGRILGWIRDAVCLGMLLGGASAGAQESQIKWQITVPAGHSTVYNTQAEAVEAIKALPPPSDLPAGWPNPFPDVDTIKGGPVVTADGKTSITYWMGLQKPLDPDWRYMNWMGGEFLATQQQAEAALIEFADQTGSPNCPQSSKIVSATPWVPSSPTVPEVSETRDYTLSVTRGDNTEESPCVAAQEIIGLVRQRYFHCPKPLAWWNTQYQACANDQYVATITTDKILECGGEVNNPYNVKTGEKIEHQTDFDLGWIIFTRSYHSGTAARSGGFGVGWTHSLDFRLSVSPGTLGLSGGSGYQVRYQKVGDAYLAADSSGDRIVASGSQWLLYRNDDVLIFDGKGRLIEQRAENGTALIYTYNPTGRLDKITHSTGRSLNFLYADDSGDA